MPESIINRTHKPQGRKPLVALFYGPPGSGKTQLGGTAPDPLILDFDRGEQTLKGQNQDIMGITQWSEVIDTWHTLASGQHQWRSVVLDTVSMMQEVASRETKLLSDFTSGNDPRNSYGRISAMMKDMLWKFALLPMNVIFTAHLRIEEDDAERKNRPEEGTYALIPDVTPAILKVLTAAPDLIGRTFVRTTPKGPVYGVSFGPDTRSVAKQRALGLPAEVANLTIPKLIDLKDKGGTE